MACHALGTGVSGGKWGMSVLWSWYLCQLPQWAPRVPSCSPLTQPHITYTQPPSSTDAAMSLINTSLVAYFFNASRLCCTEVCVAQRRITLALDRQPIRWSGWITLNMVCRMEYTDYIRVLKTETFFSVYPLFIFLFGMSLNHVVLGMFWSTLFVSQKRQNIQ